MKKAIIKMLSLICVGLMIISCTSESICAVTYNNPKQQVSVQAKTTKKVTTKKSTNTVKTKKYTNKKATTKKQTKSNKSKKVATKKVSKKQVKNNKKSKKQSKTLTKSQALNLVKKLEPEINGFTYMGNENTYRCIKENGIKGYVFLPNCDGDMAYLVDKQTSHIYFFHPSGYFELLQ